MEKRYNATLIEKDKYDFWKSKGYFKAGDTSKPPFSMVLPPPNVTGQLHLGHACDSIPADISARYKKLKGFDVMWLPGVDHAGIATQAKVEEQLRLQGISKYDIGREKFLELTWEWKEKYANRIHEQWATLGLSLDYSRERFTLDEGLQKSVKKVFKDLYDKGYIYRGERIINYDPILKTALSNIEVIYEDVPGKFYYFKYFIENSESYLEVATTRPETMFGDSAVFVNPKDNRYKHLIGKNVINPSNDKLIPILADEYVDIEFGTGAMKCTPAHDPNDFILGERYNLSKINCMDTSAKMNENADSYNGLDRFECRTKLVEFLKEKGCLIKIEDMVHSVGHSERTHCVVEPILSKQWFVKMDELSKNALEKSTVNFIPARFQKVFTQWMEKVDDWCISRQLWWGHRIPAYYHKITGDIVISDVDLGDDYIQDEDVLDTWFSSALWPFATLNGFDNSDDYKRYYPLSLMVTGYDIIFFWVSRMIFQSLEFTNISPFKDCLIHGLIRDSQGRKMSKSLGNGVDPTEVINKYGADALRYFLTTCSTPGMDTRYNEDKVIASANYLNKIWNSARYVLEQLGENFTEQEINYNCLNIVEKDILSKLNQTIDKVTYFMDKYEYALACSHLYNFIYDDFCSKYLEMSKVSLKIGDEQYSNMVKNVLFKILKSIIIMIHPYAPFISEEIYWNLPMHKESILLESFPVYNKDEILSSTQVEEMYKIIQEVRNYKVNNKLAPNCNLKLTIQYKDEPFPNFCEYLKRFTFSQEINLVTLNENPQGVKFVHNNFILFINENISLEEKEEKRKADIKFLENEIKRCQSLLSNENFVKKAHPSKIEAEKQKLDNYTKQLQMLM